MSDPNYLKPFPEEQVPPTGPKTNWGCLLWVLMIPLALGLLLGLFVASTNPEGLDEQSSTEFWVLGALFMLLLVGIVINHRRVIIKQGGIDVMRDVLNFTLDPNPYNMDVVVLCRPDEVARGGQTTLLIFMQNYSARSRQFALKLPRSKALGELNSQVFHFDIGPGQCAVYRQGFHVPSDIPAQFYGLAAAIKVNFLDSSGVRLIPKTKSDKGLLFTRSRTVAMVLEVTQERVDTDSPDYIPSTTFLSIYTPGMTEPRFEVIEQVANLHPHEEIVFSSELQSPALEIRSTTDPERG